MVGRARVAGSAALSLVTAATPLRPESGLFEAMLTGWAAQQRSRRLGESIISSRERTVRRFGEFSGGWPWEWGPAQLEAWIDAGGWAHSTVRAYQGAVAAFLDYVCDPRYGWVAECEQQLGVRPTQICHEDNTAVPHPHRRTADYLRAILVANQVLPARDEALVRTERFLAATLAGIDHDPDRRLIAAFATWRVLRRLRRSAGQHPRPRTYTRRAHQQISAAVRFLDWLTEQHTGLREATQSDIDAWLAGGPETYQVRDFID